MGSAYDVSDVRLDERGRAAFAGLCAQRATALWADDWPTTLGPLVEKTLNLVFDALSGPDLVAAVPPLREVHGSFLAELHPDCDFGAHHSAKLDAFVAVAHSVDAVLAVADGSPARPDSVEAAQAEVRMLEVLFFARTGSYDGVDEHESLVRVRRWQADDLEALAAGDGQRRLQELRARADARGRLLRVGVGRGEPT